MLNQTYRKMMENHPYGYACYQPESSLIVKPAALGYVNADGRWNPLLDDNGQHVDLSNPETLAPNGLTAFNELHPASTEEMRWGPKISNGAKGSSLNFSADASLIPAGIPADIGALFKFQTDESFGAILLATNPIIRDAVYYERSYRTWCAINAQVIVSKWPDVIDHGLVIITSIHKTRRADLRSWQDKGKVIHIGFRAASIRAGEIAPSSEWYKEQGDDGWISSESPDNSSEQRVVFFGGLHWQFNEWSKIFPGQNALRESKLKRLRGNNQFTVCHKGSDYVVSYEEWGKGLTSAEPPTEKDEEDLQMEY